MNPPCPVCRAPDTQALMTVKQRRYRRCPTCEARYLDARDLPPPAIELAHYGLHQNDVNDPRYRSFLARLADPLLCRLRPRSRGLDFGCGPGPALAAMLREAGHEMAVYDPIFFPDVNVLQQRYAFITCTETVEHFHHPAAEFERLDGLLADDGWLAIMTCFQTDDSRFADWHYRRDPTHVVFYREATLRQIARQHGWLCEIPVKDVALMHKPAAR